MFCRICFFFLLCFGSSAFAQGPGTPGLCLSRGTKERCGSFFVKPPEVSCSNDGCVPGPNSGCSPTQAIQNRPDWSTMTKYEAIKTPAGEAGSVANYVAVNCTVTRKCVCLWDDDYRRYYCGASTSWTPLNSYSSLQSVPNDPGCIGDGGGFAD